MDTTRLSVLLTFVGSVFLIDLFFLVNLVKGLTNLSYLLEFKEVHPYLATAIIPIAYFFGFASHAIINQWIVPLILGNKQSDPAVKEAENEKLLFILQYGSQPMIDHVQNNHARFNAYRLLLVATALAFVIPVWTCRSEYSSHSMLVFILWFFSLFIFGLVYLRLRKTDDAFEIVYAFLKKEK